MTRSASITVPCLLLLLVTAACSKPGGESATPPAASPHASRITSESVVQVEAQPVKIRAGESAEVTVRVTIQSGYHVNANPPTYPYLRATELEIAPGDGVSLFHITYPRPLERTFAFAEKPLAVYEGATELKATLKAEESATKGERSISGRLRIQACDNQVCYPPGTKDLVIPVTVQ